MKAPFAYYGGKMTLASTIVGLMPPHRVYVEPFFGSGAVLFAKPPAPIEIVNDLDGAVVNFFRVLRERREDLELACALSPHSREEYQAAHIDEAEIDDLERARRFWVGINQSFARRAKRSGWSLTTARTQSFPATMMSRIGRFGPVAERLSHVSFEQYDATRVIERLATSEDCCVYCDPPYLAATRSAGGGLCAKSNEYRFDMGDQEAHRRLAEALHATPATVILSGYPSELYEELYDDWWAIDCPAYDMCSNMRGKKRAKRQERTERLWLNKPPFSGLPLLEGIA